MSLTELEKLTNANRSSSTVNDRLFPVELTKIADWRFVSEYMLHSNFGQNLTRVIGKNFGAHTFILPLSLFPKYLSTFWMFYQWKEYLNKKIYFGIYANKLRSILTSPLPLEWFCSNSVSGVVLNAAAKSSCFNVQVIKNKVKLEWLSTDNLSSPLFA